MGMARGNMTIEKADVRKAPGCGVGKKGKGKEG